MDAALQESLLDRLASDPPKTPGAEDLVLAALLGDDELDTALAEGTAPERPSPQPVGTQTEPPGVYVQSVTVEGFRGIGPAATLSLEPGPGLTLVVGRNGSGKSSFAEGLEIVLTGDNARWSGKKSKVWRDSWRNLHHADRRDVTVELLVDGQPNATSVSRTWVGDVSLDAGETTGIVADWSDPLVTYRPFLSHSELGTALEAGPTSVFEALATILGLGEVSEAEEALRLRRLSRKREFDDAQSGLAPVLESLTTSDDERAAQCHLALSGKNWDLDAAELHLLGASEDGDPEAPLHLLRTLAAIQIADPDNVSTAVTELRQAGADLGAKANTDAAQSRRLADLLDAALKHHEHTGDGPCPVCQEGAIDAGWRAKAESERAELHERAEAFDRVQRRAVAAEQGCRALFASPPTGLDQADTVGLDSTTVRVAWERWSAAPASADQLADHMEQTFAPLSAALSQLRTDAQAELARREDRWRPLAQTLREWITRARVARAGYDEIKTIAAAENWLHAALETLRTERFAPIEDQVLANWELLRQGSSVSLDGVRLTGKAHLRQVVLDVTIDEVEGAALGVMSQGELYSLALCLFLPRAMARESPFRFIVIDDPVQAMDPAKVDGLARVLERAAAHRQVVVFTHDDRLPEAVRRMQIPGRVIEVTRRPASIVHLRESTNPVERLLDDARALTKEELPEAVAARIVPGLLREAIEAATIDCVRRRRLKRGQPHADVEALLVGTTKLYPRVALALFDDPERSGDVLTHVKNKYGKASADALSRCNKGAHEGASGDLLDLVRQTAKLARKLIALA